MTVNRTAFLTEIGKIEIKDMPVEEVGENDAMIRVEYCGICGSDMHFYQYGCIGKNVAPLPFVLGHECSGTVVKIGKKVTNLKVGDRVAVEPGVPCGKCAACKKGLYNICDDVHFLAAVKPVPVNGALRQYLIHQADFCHKLPDCISFQEGAMLEPLSVGLHASVRGGVSLGKKCCILGAGTIGIMTLLAAKAFGASDIVISDMFDSRLQRAKELGADYTVNAKTGNLDEVMKEVTEGKGFDIVFEAAGSSATMTSSPGYVKRGGVIVSVGNVTKDTSFPFYEITQKEADIRPVWRYRNDFPLAIDAVRTGKIKLLDINPRIFPFEESDKAFSYTRDNAQNVLKTLIHVNG